MCAPQIDFVSVSLLLFTNSLIISCYLFYNKSHLLGGNASLRESVRTDQPALQRASDDQEKKQGVQLQIKWAPPVCLHGLAYGSAYGHSLSWEGGLHTACGVVHAL